ncbi:hypothetical protein [Candidatus Binatus soli]|jgi:hypothetical protein|uniref:hypothetical protein n=1 Tax=Candidatus Binatus soli TaxID=1953413 RepID=UPI003D0B00D7
MAAKEETPLRFTTKPRRSLRTGSSDPLTSAVFDLSMAVGELKNAVATLSAQGQDQTKELRKISGEITGAKAIAKFVASVAAFIGVATIIKLWPVIHGWFAS